MIDQSQRRPSLTSRLATVFRPKRSKKNLNIQADTSLTTILQHEHGSLCNDTIFKSDARTLDEQTGERRDNTAMLHELAHYGSFESFDNETKLSVENLHVPGERNISRLPCILWQKIATYLSLCDIVCLATTSKTLLHRIGTKHWHLLQEPEYEEEKIKFLITLNQRLPQHLLCFPCAKYHKRTKIGNETLRPTMVLNPLFECASVGRYGKTQPKIRLTPGHTLPFSFVQLVTRAHNYTPSHGIPVLDLCRRYKDREGGWNHQTRYYIHQGHLLLRVISQKFAASGLPVSGQRHLLYSREDYKPYFSCCSHWRDGDLMDICKCALSHITDPYQMTLKQSTIQRSPSSSLLGSLCSFCRPMRRCPECPTEYLVELKLSEDIKDPIFRFKQSIVITRWSDLGSGFSPSQEWSAVNGEAAYESFARLGKRAISATFEAQSGVAIPGQRLISLNPKNLKRSEKANDWY